MQTVSRPRKDGTNKRCGFCYYFEGDPKLQSCGSSSVKFDNTAKGKCLKTNGTRTAGQSGCSSQFKLSYEAERYAT